MLNNIVGHILTKLKCIMNIITFPKTDWKLHGVGGNTVYVGMVKRGRRRGNRESKGAGRHAPPPQKIKHSKKKSKKLEMLNKKLISWKGSP